MGLFEAGPALLATHHLGWVNAVYGDVQNWATKRQQISVSLRFIEINYPALVRDPQSIVSGLVQFVGAEQLPNEVAMSAVVDPSLHRQKR